MNYSTPTYIVREVMQAVYEVIGAYGYDRTPLARYETRAEAEQVAKNLQRVLG